MADSKFQSRRAKSDGSVRQPNANDTKNTFLRNRTLTGSQSPHVRSVSEKRGVLQSSRLSVQGLRRHRFGIGAAMLTAWILVGVCIFLLDQFIGEVDLRISDVSSTQKDKDQIQLVVQDYFSTRPLERFRFAVDSDQFDSYVREELPSIERVAFDNGSGLTSTDGDVVARKPVARWKLGSIVYYVDASGRAYQQNYYSEPAVSVSDKSGLPASEQQTLASRSFLSFIGQTVAEVQKQKAGTVQDIIIPPGTLKQVNLRLKGRAYDIRMQTDRNPVEQVMDLKASLGYVDRNQVSPQYLDVRVAGKAYYR